MKRYLHCFLALLALLPAWVTALAQGSAPPVQQFTLANGMTVIVKPDRRAPTALHMVWLRVGSMDEVDGSSGLAHALEHMMFRGTPQVPAGEFSRRVAALGGRENAFTSRDMTGYYQQIPADRLEDVMKLEADRFANNQWSDEEFLRELEVVKEERRLRTEDDPRSLLHEQLNAQAFTASPYRRPVVGWMSDLMSLRPQDARDFYRRWYVPANATVVVVGDVDPAQVRALAEKYYGPIPSRPVPERKPQVEPEQAGLRQFDFKAPAAQGYVALAFKVPQLSSFEPGPANDDAAALSVLAAVLDGYQGARLDRGLTQGPDRVADSVGAHAGLWGRGPQLFTLDAIPVPGKSPEQVIAALRAEVARVAREGVSEAELERVKIRRTASEVYRRDSMMSQARELASAWLLGLPLDAPQRLMQRLQAVTADQVKAVAGRYFGDDQLTIAVLRPLPVDPNRKPRAAAAGSRH